MAKKTAVKTEKIKRTATKGKPRAKRITQKGFMLEKIGPVEKDAADDFFCKQSDLRHPKSHYQVVDLLASALKRQLISEELDALVAEDGPVCECALTRKKFQPVKCTKITQELIAAVVKAGSVIVDVPQEILAKYQTQGNFMYLRVGTKNKIFGLKGPLFYKAKDGKYRPATARYSPRRSFEKALYEAKEKRKEAKEVGGKICKSFSYFFGSYDACVAFKEKDVAEFESYRSGREQQYAANRAEIDKEYQVSTRNMGELMKSFGLNVEVLVDRN